MAMGMIKSFEGISVTLKKSMGKMSGKKKKAGSFSGQYDSAINYLNERRAAKGGAAAPVAPAPQPSAPSTGNSGNGGNGIYGAIDQSGL